MEVKTKFKPGDSVWIMKDNKPTCVVIEFISIIKYIDSQETFYKFKGLDNGFRRDLAYELNENQLFSSKKKLVMSLLKSEE